MFNVGFLSSRVTRACLNAVGKMPVRREVLVMCVSAVKVWERLLGEGARGLGLEDMLLDGWRGEVWILLAQGGDRRRRWEFEPYM